jgi:hypothetical protein
MMLSLRIADDRTHSFRSLLDALAASGDEVTIHTGNGPPRIGVICEVTNDLIEMDTHGRDSQHPRVFIPVEKIESIALHR